MPVEGELPKPDPPPSSLVLAWMLGVALFPIKFISLTAIGPCGLLMMPPLLGILGYLLTRNRWIRPLAIVFFLADAGLLSLGVVAAIHFGILAVAVAELIGVTICAIICACLFQRSASDYYYRPAT
ncbi:hypothetical protein [Blastopirellula marina]|uniref:DUF2069 domain-containing protein n=1 Tax=Blastopirellula marina TaxID=124 RepID=A0A2S8FXQ7_9BACT|nr:hypothetical protein [Blastopirellula marina]PQO36624.1 hypothetical protein C5Y98_11555 [Blastopirellula marina]PTL44454.1 hypothetical protein C5Y97_11565 [Blastopirellula marina]